MSTVAVRYELVAILITRIPIRNSGPDHCIDLEGSKLMHDNIPITRTRVTRLACEANYHQAHATEQVAQRERLSPQSP